MYELEKAGKQIESRLRALDENETFTNTCGHHFDLLLRWNRVHNLTRITDPKVAAVGHYWDCVQAVDALREHLAARAATERASSQWADIGSGAGFPGILCALREPAISMRWVEPAKKRASFLSDVVRRLSLSNVVVEATRVQEMAPAPLILSRATLPWREAQPAFESVSSGGVLALMVSDDPDIHQWDEIATGWGATSTASLVYSLPSIGDRRVLIAHKV